MTSEKIQKNVIFIFSFLFVIPMLLVLSKPGAATYKTMVKPVFSDTEITGFSVKLTSGDPKISALSADPTNKYELKVKVTNSKGEAVPYADVLFTIDGPAPADCSFEPEEGETGADGSFTTFFIPPASLDNNIEKNTDGSITVELGAKLKGTERSSSIKIKLVPVPVVLVHGYQASPEIFFGLREYMSEDGYASSALDYNSEKGIAFASFELSKYLAKRKSALLAEGIRVKRFDLVAHSMGGLVARYYTCSKEYLSRNDVRKLIFVSVPQKGSPFASLGLQYYNDNSIRDMATDSKLITDVFPAMINSGLNPSIETGSILDRFDEVVSVQNASLADWKINTGIYDVGESNLTVDKLMNGEILKATNHKRILYNMKVYQKIVEMLGNQMPYPVMLSK